MNLLYFNHGVYTFTPESEVPNVFYMYNELF